VRKELEWEGYAMLAPGLLAHPAADAPTLAEILERVKGTGKIFVCSAAELPESGSRPLGELVHEGWDCPAWSPITAASSPNSRRCWTCCAKRNSRRRHAFVVRSLLIHAYRRVQLHDPMLPLDLLPQPWPGSEAYALAQAIYRLTWERAEAHLMDVLGAKMRKRRRRTPGFYDRFGGLR
jgi:phenylacetic acid degradation operon negative regulatory protein